MVLKNEPSHFHLKSVTSLKSGDQAETPDFELSVMINSAKASFIKKLLASRYQRV
jgi:hypothetical protein